MKQEQSARRTRRGGTVFQYTLGEEPAFPVGPISAGRAAST